MKVKIINKSTNDTPEYSTLNSAGMDLRADLSSSITLKPFDRILIKTGLFLEIPQGFEAQVRPRSGLAIKKGITVLNSPGTIDADYRGEVGVILINLSKYDFIINNGERIAQLVFASFSKADFLNVDVLEETKRGAKGFGSSGVK